MYNNLFSSEGDPMFAQTLPTQPADLTQPLQPALRPIPFWLSLLLFFVPALGLVWAFYAFRPWLENQGYDSLTSLLAAMTIPLALLFAAALIAYRRLDGYPLEAPIFRQRMRFPRLTVRQMLWGLGLGVACLLSYGLFSSISLVLIEAGFIHLPVKLPILVDPHVTFSPTILNQAAGGVIRGRWDIAVLYLVMFFFNIAGEELWWRGYILPRQELVHGRATWLVHGLLWALFHVYKWWDILNLLPLCLLISLASQRLKTNWPGLIAHTLVNGISLLLILFAVIGF
jgi:membrane protease YdiL (CAAX protease family)